MWSALTMLMAVMAPSRWLNARYLGTVSHYSRGEIGRVAVGLIGSVPHC